MNKSKPPSSSHSKSSPFLVGKDSHGHWVVQDQRGLRGGLFVDRAQALKYAMFENGRQPQAVIMVPGVLEFEHERQTSLTATNRIRILSFCITLFAWFRRRRWL